MKTFMRATVAQLAVLMVIVGMTQAIAQAQEQTRRLVQIDDATGEIVEVAPGSQAANTNVVTQTQPGIVILNNQKSDQSTAQAASQAAIQDQPTNIIEDSPLTISTADQRRLQRKALEQRTEQRIVEKLEESRIQDERSRSERLFGNGLAPADGGTTSQQPPQVQVIQVPAQATAVDAAAQAEKAEAEKIDVKEQVKAALQEMQPKEQANKKSFYVSGLVGVGDYPDAINVRGNVSTGFAVGIVTEERFVAEGTFQYSEFDIEDMMVGYSYGYPPFKTLNQYNFQAALKYQILGGKIRPVVGAVAGYTYRSYSQKQPFFTGSVQDVSSNAFDIGALAGLDVQLTDTFSLGVDFRYMKNIGYRENSDYQQSFVYPRAGKSVEEMNYYIGSLTGRFTF